MLSHVRTISTISSHVTCECNECSDAAKVTDMESMKRIMDTTLQHYVQLKKRHVKCNHEEGHDETWLNQTVLCHNDLLPGNILYRPDLSNCKDSNDEVVLIDFEYADLNPRAFDIANHFCEYIDYDTIHDPTNESHVQAMRQIMHNHHEAHQAFFRGYIYGKNVIKHSFQHELMEKNIQRLVRSCIEKWMPLAHVFWIVWAVLQSVAKPSRSNMYQQLAIARANWLTFCLMS